MSSEHGGAHIASLLRTVAESPPDLRFDPMTWRAAMRAAARVVEEATGAPRDEADAIDDALRTPESPPESLETPPEPPQAIHVPLGGRDGSAEGGGDALHRALVRAERAVLSAGRRAHEAAERRIERGE